MTRNGKIAHLPGSVRDDLNRRLDNGQEGETLLAWLNGQPDVRKILKAHFDRAPITKQNLSEWRQGGFREWQLRQEWLGQARQLSEGALELDNAVETHLLPGALAGALAARYAALLNGWDGQPDPKFEEQLRLLRGLNRDIALLQKTLHQAHRYERELEQAAEQRDRSELEELKQKTLNLVTLVPEYKAMVALLGPSEQGLKLAEHLIAVKYGLHMPMEKLLPQAEGKGPQAESGRPPAPSEPGRPTQSKPVQASPTPSNGAKPGPTEPDPAVQPSPSQSNPVAPDSDAASTPEAASETSQEGD